MTADFAIAKLQENIGWSRSVTTFEACALSSCGLAVQISCISLVLVDFLHERCFLDLKVIGSDRPWVAILQWLWHDNFSSVVRSSAWAGASMPLSSSSRSDLPLLFLDLSQSGWAAEAQFKLPHFMLVKSRKTNRKWPIAAHCVHLEPIYRYI